MKINHTQDVSKHKTDSYPYQLSQEAQSVKTEVLILDQEEAAILTISQEGQEQAASKERKADNKNAGLAAYQQMADRERMKREEGNDTTRIQLKCMKIAMHITAGDKVPQQDISYLIEHDPDLYGRAMNMRILKSDPEECESVLDEEERKEVQGGLTGAAPSIIIDTVESGK